MILMVGSSFGTLWSGGSVLGGGWSGGTGRSCVFGFYSASLNRIYPEDTSRQERRFAAYLLALARCLDPR
jgi:hypothetical protein